MDIAVVQSLAGHPYPREFALVDRLFERSATFSMREIARRSGGFLC